MTTKTLSFWGKSPALLSRRRRLTDPRAGVVGLTSALALLERGYRVSVVAKHMPGDYDAAEYASPFGGANWWSVADAGSREAHWDELTFGCLWRLATQVPAAGIHVQDSRIYRRGKDRDTVVTRWQNTLLSDEPWFRGLVPGFRRLRADELLAVAGADSGTAFTSVCINVAVFLPYLVSQCLARGGTFRRATVAHVCEAAGLHASGQRAAVVVNCSGLMACRLGGVMDGKVIPVRGQIVMVRNEIPAMINISGTDDGPDEGTYLMMRAAGASLSLSLSYTLPLSLSLSLPHTLPLSLSHTLPPSLSFPHTPSLSLSPTHTPPSLPPTPSLPLSLWHLQLTGSRRRRHGDWRQLPEGQLGYDPGPKHGAEDPEARHRGVPAASEARAGRRRARHHPGLCCPAPVADRRRAPREGGD